MTDNTTEQYIDYLRNAGYTIVPNTLVVHPDTIEFIEYVVTKRNKEIDANLDRLITESLQKDLDETA